MYLAHELNNTLSVVVSGSDIIEDGSDPAETRTAAAAVAAAAQTGLDLAARVAALARQGALAPVPADLNAVLAESRARFERAAGGRTRLRLVLADHPLPALIDVDQFAACVVEMIIAASATRPGQVILRTELLTDDARPARSDGRAAVTVEAEGRPDAIASGVTRTSHSTEIVASFARFAGGRFDPADDRMPRRARLCVPLAEADPARAARGLARKGRDAKGLKVVVVEDNDFLRGVLARGLRARGLEVSEARDAAEARAVATVGTAVLVTDVVLPGDMDGFALARWARGRDPRVALVFLSAFMSARLPEVLASDELASFVRKPIELDALVVVLEGLLALRGDPLPLAGAEASPTPHDSARRD